MKKITWFYIILVVITFVVSSKLVSAEEYLNKGDYELTFSVGGGTGLKILSSKQAHDLLEGNIAIGYIATNNFFKGKFYQFNFEPMAELTPIGYQYKPTNKHYAGGSLIARVNFTNLDPKIIPFFEAGGSANLTNIGKPDLCGLTELGYLMEGGVRYMVNQHYSINTGLRWRHISCAGLHNDKLGHRNNGVNCLELMLFGASYIW